MEVLSVGNVKTEIQVISAHDLNIVNLGTSRRHLSLSKFLFRILAVISIRCGVSFSTSWRRRSNSAVRILRVLRFVSSWSWSRTRRDSGNTSLDSGRFQLTSNVAPPLLVVIILNWTRRKIVVIVITSAQLFQQNGTHHRDGQGPCDGRHWQQDEVHRHGSQLSHCQNDGCEASAKVRFYSGVFSQLCL